MNDFINVGMWVVWAAFSLWGMFVFAERFMWAWDNWLTPRLMRWYCRRHGLPEDAWQGRPVEDVIADLEAARPAAVSLPVEEQQP